MGNGNGGHVLSGLTKTTRQNRLGDSCWTNLETKVKGVRGLNSKKGALSIRREQRQGELP